MMVGAGRQLVAALAHPMHATTTELLKEYSSPNIAGEANASANIPPPLPPPLAVAAAMRHLAAVLRQQPIPVLRDSNGRVHKSTLISYELVNEFQSISVFSFCLFVTQGPVNSSHA